MNTKSGLILAILLLAGSTLGSYAARTQEETLRSHTAKLSYSMGLRVGKILASQNIDIDPVLFLRGLKDGRSRQEAPLPAGEQFHEAGVTFHSAPTLEVRDARNEFPEKSIRTGELLRERGI
ncbi:MAG TPA: FKBP-type peptidyl-prolyl cis-trans isomerase N-terminal domain-containing protein [Methylococcaceae bacterium]|nr:FKBP-type peptidyl-prolyl cis-trans isomerase N-terminal domain-containing protein [Methylococcaceae bacterium]